MKSQLALASALLLSACAGGASYSPPPAASPSPRPYAIRPVPHPTPPPPARQAEKPALQMPASVPSAGPLRTAMVGGYMDNQERDFREHLRGLGVGVARPGDDLVLSAKDEKWFEDNSSQLTRAGADALATIAIILRHYDHTAISIRDFSDDGAIHPGGDPRDRAQVVARQLKADGVAANRIYAQGYGATRRTVATGQRVSTPQSRRIEIRVSPRASG
jgi:outer membrane protein OmpA-like peptidoglycan-associated protein